MPIKVGTPGTVASSGQLVSVRAGLSVAPDFGTVADQAAMVALTDATPGSTCYRTDTSSVWVLKVSPPTLAGSWFNTDAAYAAAVAASAIDATTKANNAQSLAISAGAADATSKANAAQATAISTASADATTKANAAQSAAIAAAAADATTKANTAQSNAIAAAYAADAIVAATAAAALPKAGGKMTGAIELADSVNVASASTVDLGAVNSNNVVVTGSGTINSFGDAPGDTQRQVYFAGGTTLTYGASSIICPGAVNMVVPLGSFVTVRSRGPGNGWRFVSALKADGTPIVGGGTGTLASQAEAEAGAENTKFLSSLRTKQAIDFQRPLASQAQAEAGDETGFVMDPLRVAQAIAALGGGGGGNVATDTIFDAAGDLVVGSGANAAARLAIGTVGQKLTVTGASTVAWASATGVAPEDVSGTTYTFVEADAGKVKRFTNVSGCSATINSGLSSGWGCTVVRGVGAGTLTLVQGTATLTSLDGVLTVNNEKGVASIVQIAADSYLAAGGLGRPRIVFTNFSANTTLDFNNAGGLLHPAADTNNWTVTIPANATTAFEVGTVIPIVNEVNTVTISITTDTLLWAGTASSGSRTLSAPGMCTLTKVTTTKWLISGSGLA